MDPLGKHRRATGKEHGYEFCDGYQKISDDRSKDRCQRLILAVTWSSFFLHKLIDANNVGGMQDDRPISYETPVFEFQLP